MIIFRKSKKKLIIPVGINPNINGELTSQSKTVDSSTNEQTVIPDEGYDYLDSVKVNPYSLEGAVTVTPSEQSQTITPSEGYDGFSSVTVEGLDIQQATVNSSTNEQVITPDPSSYFDSVTVHPYVLQEKSVESSTFVQTIVPDAGYDGLSSVDIQSYTLQDKTVDPSVNSQTVTWDEGYDGIRSVTVNPVTSSIDSNIQAANIKMGVSILGVSGTYEGSNITPVEPPENDVIFIDYNGKIMYSYSKDEFLALNAMPQNPEHTGLVSEGWNWTLADAKDYVEDYDRLVIGQLYHTDDGTTRIHITLDEETEVLLRFYLPTGDGNDGTTIVYWGDGTQTAVTNNTNTKEVTKTLPAGMHTIKIKVRDDLTYRLASGNNIEINGIIHKSDLTSIDFDITGIELANNCVGMQGKSYKLYNLAYITTHGNFALPEHGFETAYTLPAYIFGENAVHYGTGSEFLSSGVKYVSFAKTLKNVYTGSWSNRITNNMFESCSMLRLSTFPTVIEFEGSSLYVPNFSSALKNCKRLKHANLGSIDMGGGTFSGCSDLKSIHAGWTTAPSIATVTFNGVPTSVKIHIPCGTALSYLSKWGEVGQYKYPEGCTEPFPDPTTPYMTTDGGVFFDTGVLVKPGVTFEFLGSVIDPRGEILHGTHGAESGGVDSVNLRIFRTYSSLYTDLSYNERMSLYTGNLADYDVVKWFASSDGHMDITYNGTHRSTSRTANTNTSTLPIAIFGAYSNSTTKEYAQSGNILYYARIWENGVVTKHYVPAKDANDVVCLHELIGDTYLYNTGSGTPAIDYNYKEITYDENLPW